MTSEGALHQRADTWSRCAQDYEDCFVPLSSAAAGAALDRIGLLDGERFLDVATGTGAVAIEAARRGASVTAVDFAPEMLALLERKLRLHRVGNVKTLQMDAQALDLADGSFDAVGSSFGIVFCPDVARAIGELHRVVRSGGRVFLSTLSTAPPNPLMGLIVRSLLSADPDLAPPRNVVELELSKSRALAAGLRDAGFRQIRVESAVVPWELADPADFWDRWAIDAPPMRAMLPALSGETRARAREAFVRLVASEFGGQPVSFPMDVLIGCGIR